MIHKSNGATSLCGKAGFRTPMWKNVHCQDCIKARVRWKR